MVAVCEWPRSPGSPIGVREDEAKGAGEDEVKRIGQDGGVTGSRVGERVAVPPAPRAMGTGSGSGTTGV